MFANFQPIIANCKSTIIMWTLCLQSYNTAWGYAVKHSQAQQHFSPLILDGRKCVSEPGFPHFQLSTHYLVIELVEPLINQSWLLRCSWHSTPGILQVVLCRYILYSATEQNIINTDRRKVQIHPQTWILSFINFHKYWV